MIGFIKNWLNPKSYKEDEESKANLISRVEDCKEDKEILKSQLISEIEGNILNVCFGGLRPGQEECPRLIIYQFKKLLEISNEESLVRTTDYLSKFLSESQYKDFTNKVSQLKEYKEYILKKRINKLNEDF